MSNALLDNQSITIGQGVTFKGSLNVPSKAVINGTVDGDLTAVRSPSTVPLITALLGTFSEPLKVTP